jgi:hypothetical protein
MKDRGLDKAEGFVTSVAGGASLVGPPSFTIETRGAAIGRHFPTKQTVNVN